MRNVILIFYFPNIKLNVTREYIHIRIHNSFGMENFIDIMQIKRKIINK